MKTQTIHRRSALRLAATGAAVAAGMKAAAPAKERIVGVYRLARVVRRTADGQETVTNANPTGRISYDKSGRVMILLAPAERKAPKDPRNVTMEEYQDAARGLMAYYGTYQVDEANQKLIERAIEMKTDDNITVVLADLSGDVFSPREALSTMVILDSADESEECDLPDLTDIIAPMD